MKLKKKKLFVVSVIIFSFFTLSIVSNYKSLENAKDACVDKTPIIEQGFLAINWSVSCK